MKKIVRMLFVSLLIISSLNASAEGIDAIRPPKSKNIFTLKTAKYFVGAQVEVYNSRGELISAQSLQKRKMVIDFGETLFGTYTIRIVKGAVIQEFKYVKK